MAESLSRFEAPPLETSPPREGDVDIWRVTLDLPPASVAPLERLLSPDEEARASCFHFPLHRRRYIVARAALRRLLGGYLRLHPRAIQFGYGDRGKPFLAGESTRSPVARLRFNVTHSEELALIAVTRGHPVGIDVEALRPLPAALDLATRYFSPAERASLAALPDAERETAFFRCWTRKEAYVKALGDGFSAPLDRFDVSLDPGDGARLIAVDDDPAAAAAWTLVHVDAGANSIGALALRAHPRAVRGWQWRSWLG